MRQSNSGSDNTALVIEETEVANAVPQRSIADRLLAGGKHFLDGASVFLLTTALMSEWLHELFEVLSHTEQHDAVPSKQAQESGNVVPIILGVSAVLTMIVKAANHYFSKENAYYAAEDRFLFPAFLSSFYLFVFQLIFNQKTVESMPIGAFAATSAIGFPVIAASAMHLASPETGDQCIFGLKDLENLNPRAYPDASKKERYMNAVRMSVKAGFCFATLLTTIDREVYGKTVSLIEIKWQVGLLLLSMPLAAKVGFEWTNHPRFSHASIATLRFIENGSLVYRALSGIVFAAVVGTNPDKVFQMDNDSQQALTYLLFIMSACMGVYSAATTLFPFEENHESNEKIIQGVEAAPHKIKAGCHYVFEKSSNAVQFFATKIQSCFASASANENLSENHSLNHTLLA